MEYFCYRREFLIPALLAILWGGQARAGDVDGFVEIVGSSLTHNTALSPSDGFITEQAFRIYDTSPAAIVYNVAPGGGGAEYFFLSFANLTGHDLYEVDIRLGTLSAENSFIEGSSPMFLAGPELAGATFASSEDQILVTATHGRAMMNKWLDTQVVRLQFPVSVPDTGLMPRRDGEPGYEFAILFDTAVPEPSALAVFMIGAGLVFSRLRPVKQP